MSQKFWQSTTPPKRADDGVGSPHPKVQADNTRTSLVESKMAADAEAKKPKYEMLFDDNGHIDKYEKGSPLAERQKARNKAKQANR